MRRHDTPTTIERANVIATRFYHIRCIIEMAGKWLCRNHLYVYYIKYVYNYYNN